MQENFRVEGKKLYFGFVDLEKAFDRVPREVISWVVPDKQPLNGCCCCCCSGKKLCRLMACGFMGQMFSHQLLVCSLFLSSLHL